MVVTGAPRKRLVGKPARGFESHPLRQTSAFRSSLSERVGFRRFAACGRSGHESLLVFAKLPRSAPVCRRGWASGASRPVAAPGTNPCWFSPNFRVPLQFVGEGGLQALRGLWPLRARIPAGFRQTSAFRSSLSERVGFRRFAACGRSGHESLLVFAKLPRSAPVCRRGWASGASRPVAAPGTNPCWFSPNFRVPLQFVGEGGLQALRGLWPLRARIPAGFRQTSAFRSSLSERVGFRRFAACGRSGHESLLVFAKLPRSAPVCRRGWASGASRPVAAAGTRVLVAPASSQTPRRRPPGDGLRHDLPPSPGGNRSSMEQPKKTANFLAFSTVIVL